MMMKLKYVISLSLLLFGMCTSVFAQNEKAVKRYVKVKSGYMMVLRQGDNIMEELEKFTIAEKIPAASFTGMGFVNVTFGFFDSKAKRFDPREFKDVELASMSGTIAWQKGKPSIHTHGVVAGKDFQAYGGHILSGTVGTGSLEITVIVHEKPFERVFEDGLGANVLHLEQ